MNTFELRLDMIPEGVRTAGRFLNDIMDALTRDPGYCISLDFQETLQLKLFYTIFLCTSASGPPGINQYPKFLTTRGSISEKALSLLPNFIFR